MKFNFNNTTWSLCNYLMVHAIINHSPMLSYSSMAYRLVQVIQKLLVHSTLCLCVLAHLTALMRTIPFNQPLLSINQSSAWYYSTVIHSSIVIPNTLNSYQYNTIQLQMPLLHGLPDTLVLSHDFSLFQQLSSGVEVVEQVSHDQSVKESVRLQLRATPNQFDSHRQDKRVTDNMTLFDDISVGNSEWLVDSCTNKHQLPSSGLGEQTKSSSRLFSSHRTSHT
jgi:hypothetical protein